ncbi:MAG: fumarate hydratase [Kiritimatiellaeota bacterium]|nr:fumarate hydratase [Kiritimatiellota bacterium]
MIARLTELIRRTTSDLPADVEAALKRAAAAEPPGSQAALFLRSILENTRLAREQSTPLCQDTGMLTFFWTVPRGTDTLALERAAQDAVKAATANGWLRHNTIETLSGASLETNVADGIPACHFEQADTGAIRVALLQKGGGSENVSCQFSLPDAALGAGRDLDGARKCILHAVWQAQGFGCAPGILGVCIGADRGEGFLLAKKQLLRPLDDTSPVPELAALERRVLDETNQLGIGPMGMGGRTTLLGVKIAVAPRLPASHFVTIAYSCWACRRQAERL